MTAPVVVAVDTGGTFTDVVVVAANGDLSVFKIPSNPANPAMSIERGLSEARGSGRLVGECELVHGTTVATNALLSRSEPRTALITNRGFKDLLQIARQSRTNLYTFSPSRPVPLVDRTDVFEITSRIDWSGCELVPIDEGNLREVVEQVVAHKYRSVAICLLFSYLNGEHERRIASIMTDAGLLTCNSCDLAPEPREYERAVTTCANAYVMPVLNRYLTTLASFANPAGVSSIRIMQSNGGSMDVDDAWKFGVKTALSGPAGGVVAAEAIGRAIGQKNLITFDMGGTSTDVALLHGGKADIVTEGIVADLPLRTPMLDIHTVGSGGGSIVYLDKAGGMRVGPESAGAVPGPVAYGVGEHLTVTDANVVLGRLPARNALAGSLTLDFGRACGFMQGLADAMECSIEAAALGIIDIANAAMVRAIRHVSTERGYDPAEFALLSYGGAGGLHACAIANALGIRHIVVPQYPGAFSALGLALSDQRYEIVHTFSAGTLAGDPRSNDKVTAGYESLSERARLLLKSKGHSLYESTCLLVFNMRYAGQAFDLRIEGGSVLDVANATEAFHARHRDRYGYAAEDSEVEIVALRLEVTIATNREIKAVADGAANSNCGPEYTVEAVTSTGSRLVPVYARSKMSRLDRVVGPAIIVQQDATTFMDEDWFCDTDVYNNMHLHVTE